MRKKITVEALHLSNRQISADEPTIAYWSNEKKPHNLLGKANKLKHATELRQVAIKAEAEALEKQIS